MPVTSYVATLSNEQAQPIAVVTGDAHGGHLIVKVVAPQAIAADKSLELSAAPKAGHPRSLGLLTENDSVTLALPAGTAPESVPVLAVTLEPKGIAESRTRPTGPVVFKDAWLRI